MRLRSSRSVSITLDLTTIEDFLAITCAEGTVTLKTSSKQITRYPSRHATEVWPWESVLVSQGIILQTKWFSCDGRFRAQPVYLLFLDTTGYLSCSKFFSGKRYSKDSYGR